MNILIVSMKFPPSIGGGETIVFNTAVCLAKLGHQVHVLTEEHPESRPEDAQNGIYLIRSHTINNIAAGKLDLTKGLNDISAIIRSIDPDIIHVHNYQAAIAVFLTASNVRARIIFTQYATPIPEARKIVGYLGDYEYEEAVAQFCYKASSYAMAVEISDVYANWALQCGASPSKVHKVYAGVDMAFWKPRPADASLKTLLGIDPTDRVVFAPIRLVKRKGALDFIKAARYLHDPRIKLLICGTVAQTDPEMRAEIDALLQDATIRNRVILLDNGVPLREIPRYFSIADLVCLPSHIEGLGMVLLEAMATKTLVLATTVPGVSEIVTHNITGFMTKPHAPRALAGSIEEALNCPSAVRSRLVHNAYEMVKNQFNVYGQTQSLVSLYDEALGHSCDEAATPSVSIPLAS